MVRRVGRYEKPRIERRRRDVGHDGPFGGEHLSVRQTDAGGQPVTGLDGDHLGTGPDHPAAALKPSLQRVDHARGAAAHDRDPVGFVGEALDEGEERAAGYVWPEIDVHPPARQHRLRLGAVKIDVTELARGREEQLREVREPSSAEVAQAAGEVRIGRGRAQRRAVETEQKRAIALEERTQLAPPALVELIGAEQTLVLLDAQRRAIRKRIGERLRAMRILEPLRREVVAEGGPGGPAQESVLVRRVEVVDESGKRELGALDRSRRPPEPSPRRRRSSRRPPDDSRSRVRCDRRR